MILKISSRELRELLSSGSVPQWGVLGAVAHPVGDGRTKSTMANTGDGSCLIGADGSDHDVDKVGRWCSRPVYADVPPMPEGFLEGFPHDCTAAMFGRRFGEAFDAWLDAFDCSLRSLPGGDKGRRMLDMESYAVTDTDAVVRVYRLEGGLRSGGPFHEHRVHLKPRFLLGSGWGDYVDCVVSNEVDDLVRGLGAELGFNDSQMAGVRALVALEERPSGSRGTQETREVTGGNADEGRAGESGEEKEEKDDKVGRLGEALCGRLGMMAELVNYALRSRRSSMELVVNVAGEGLDGASGLIVGLQVFDCAGKWVRSRWTEVGAGEVEGDGCGAQADGLALERMRVAVRAIACDDWTGWCERRPDGRTVRCDGDQRAETKDYDIDDDRHVEGVGEDGGDEVPETGRGGGKG